MKILGVIGGLGPESTIEYYRTILAVHQERTRDGSYPAVVFNCIDLNRVMGLVVASQLDELARFLSSEVERLADAGAACAMISANMPHLVFNEVEQRSPLPMISIVEAAAAEAVRRGFKKLGLLGTRFTMQASFYPDVFTARGIQLMLPTAEDQEFVHDAYVTELLKGVILPDTRARLLEVITRLKQRDNVDGVILGGTELSLILRDGMDPDVPFLDTMQTQIRAAFELLAE